MATSYSNPGGSGDRRTTIVVTVTTIASGTDHTFLVNGNTTENVFFFSGAGSGIIEFWFPTAAVIDEAKYYQDLTTSHGTWKWQGSNDRSSWTDIGTTFTLGGAATQTHTTLNGNTTAYNFYRLLQTAGSTSSAPWVREFEFQIEYVGSTSYTNTLGSGNRSASITVSSSGITFGGGGGAAVADLVDGTIGGALFWDAATNTSSHYIRFDLGASYIVQQMKFHWSTAITAQGVWKVQGSNDASAWTDVTGSVTLAGDGANTTRKIHIGDATFVANATAYRYYQLLGVSGTRNGTPVLQEMDFLVAASPGGGGGAVIPRIMHHMRQQGMA